MATSKQKAQALERAYWKAHRHTHGESVNIYEVLDEYKTIWMNAEYEEREV